MYVSYLSLTDFRNYRNATLELTPGATVFLGRNGQGKTNLVESIAYLATLGSHRTPVEQALIRADTETAIIRARFRHVETRERTSPAEVAAGTAPERVREVGTRERTSTERELLAEVQLNRGAPNRARLGGNAAKPRDLPRYLHSVLFAPEDLALVRGEPGVRRRFLDELLQQRTPRLAGTFADFDRVLKQRNSLLKSAYGKLHGDQHSTLDIWDERLIGLGTEIIFERARLIAALAGPVQDVYRTIVAADHTVMLSPAQSIGNGESTDSANSLVEIAERFRAALAEIRSRELERGLTLVGPQRDDLLLTLNGLSAKGHASHGESWSLALSVRLASALLLRNESDLGDPVVILDDVFAELDEQRRIRLAELVADFEQVLITAAVVQDVPTQLVKTVIRIEAGEIVGD